MNSNKMFSFFNAKAQRRKDECIVPAYKKLTKFFETRENREHREKIRGNDYFYKIFKMIEKNYSLCVLFASVFQKNNIVFYTLVRKTHTLSGATSK